MRAARPWRRLPARARLTLWYILLLLGTEVLLGLGTYSLIARALYANLDSVLKVQAAAVLTETDYEKGRLAFDTHHLPPDQMPPVAAGLDLVRLWDVQQHLVYQSARRPDVPPPDQDTLSAALEGWAVVATASAGDRSSVRVRTQGAWMDGVLRGAVEVGRSEAEIGALLEQLQLLELGALTAAAGLACAGGYFLASRALAPIDRITRAAQHIGAENLSQRLALALPDDELGRLARAFDDMIQRLEQAFARQRRFTADASHELRTPLAILRSQAELALGRPRDPAYDAEAFHGIRDEIDRLTQVVESLLLLARADADGAVSLTPLDLEELLAETAERVAARARERGIRLELRIGETPQIRGNAALLAQLLLNLLDNALRHTPSGGQITLGVRTSSDGVRVEVTDSGIGIAPEHLPHVLERFYRADPARSRARGGSGLGLAICDWIARVHDGRLELLSQPGRGTTARICLPTDAAVKASTIDRRGSGRAATGGRGQMIR
jgi:heavy metal sensor kinase